MGDLQKAAAAYAAAKAEFLAAVEKAAKDIIQALGVEGCKVLVREGWDFPIGESRITTRDPYILTSDDIDDYVMGRYIPGVNRIVAVWEDIGLATDFAADYPAGIRRITTFLQDIGLETLAEALPHLGKP